MADFRKVNFTLFKRFFYLTSYVSLLENVIYKKFRGRKLDDKEMEFIERIIERRDYGRMLE